MLPRYSPASGGGATLNATRAAPLLNATSIQSRGLPSESLLNGKGIGASASPSTAGIARSRTWFSCGTVITTLPDTLAVEGGAGSTAGSTLIGAGVGGS